MTTPLHTRVGQLVRAFEHDGVAREIAAEKWRRLRGKLPAPLTVVEAIERQDELDPDIEIAVRHDGKFWRVTSQRLRQGVPA
jgi:hypothetical protein